jgi:hypothetical protein
MLGVRSRVLVRWAHASLRTETVAPGHATCRQNTGSSTHWDDMSMTWTPQVDSKSNRDEKKHVDDSACPAVTVRQAMGYWSR